MAEGRDGIVEQHTGAGPTHDLTNLFPHRRLVAMDRALLAGRFLLSKLAAREAFVCILLQRPVLLVHLLHPQLVATIQGNHLAHDFLFSSNASVFL